MSYTLQKLQELEGGRYFTSENVFLSEKAEPIQSLPRAELKENCAFIVSALVFKENQVLLISEAKRSCYGEWYLPAGKCEPKETLHVRKQYPSDSCDS